MATAEVNMITDGLRAPPASQPLPVLVIDNTNEDEDELLFQPESPPSLTGSSVGTPPTPEQRKFVWPQAEDGRIVEQRESELTNTMMTLEAFASSSSVDADCISSQSTPEREVCTALDRSFSIASTFVEDCDNEERTSNVSTCSTSSSLLAPSLHLNATMRAAKKKTQNVASQPREAIARFQLKGGLVGWLHGEGKVHADEGCDIAQHSDVSAVIPIEPVLPSAEQTRHGSKQRASTLIGNLRDKIKQKQEQLELKLQALEESNVSQHVSYSEPRSRSSQPRLSLQPSSRRSLRFDAGDGVSFDDFVSTLPAESASVPFGKSFLRRDSRLRSASSNEGYETSAERVSNGVRARLRSLSFAPRGAKSLISPNEANSGLASSALQWDAFPVEECLADPKLAAEFINVVLPGDEWLLALLYSIEEYEALTTVTVNAVVDSSLPLDVQIKMATTIIDRFLTSPTCTKHMELEEMGRGIRSVVCRYELPSADSTPAEHKGIASLIAAQGSTLPMCLFDNVYAYVFDKLRVAYDTKFRLTREYTKLLAHMKQQQQQLGDEKALQCLPSTRLLRASGAAPFFGCTCSALRTIIA